MGSDKNKPEIYLNNTVYKLIVKILTKYQISIKLIF